MCLIVSSLLDRLRLRVRLLPRLLQPLQLKPLRLLLKHRLLRKLRRQHLRSRLRPQPHLLLRIAVRGLSSMSPRVAVHVTVRMAEKLL